MHTKQILQSHTAREIGCFGDAQSFKRIENFDGKSYRTKEDAYALNVAAVDAYIFHYGWVRPPEYMQSKKKAMDSAYKDKQTVDAIYENQQVGFDYGPLKHEKLKYRIISFLERNLNGGKHYFGFKNWKLLKNI